MNLLQRTLHRPFFIRLFNWEYWSFNTVYGWIMPIWVLLALRTKSFFFFSASNPTIEYGGFLMESKKKIYDIIPAAYYPRTVYITEGTAAEAVIARIAALNYQYPLIAKPDVGGQGRGVKKLADEKDLIAYADNSPMDYLVQEFAHQPNEIGVFYYRYPNEDRGQVSGIVRKEMLSVTGDGVSTMLQLLKKEKRSILQLPVLQRLYGIALNEVLPPGAVKELVPYGNHARGAKFLDDSHLADEVFRETMDHICKQVAGFHYGRLDIRYNTWEELRRGENFSIIELNGAGSEPTHMYDPAHSIFFAWKEIVRHWIILWRISRINHKKGIPYLTHQQGMQMMKDNKVFEQKLNRLYV
ncbi:MAG: hypothetical protein ABIU63_12245 [Chitinophagaceae bacterium]